MDVVSRLISQEHVREFAAFIVALDEEDIPVVLWDRKFVAHVALLADHPDQPNAVEALSRLLAAVAARAH